MTKQPSELTTEELMGLRAVNTARDGQVAFSFYSETGARWDVVRGNGEPWVRVYGGYDLDQRTLPYVCGPGFTGRRHGLNPPWRPARAPPEHIVNKRVGVVVSAVS